MKGLTYEVHNAALEATGAEVRAQLHLHLRGAVIRHCRDRALISWDTCWGAVNEVVESTEWGETL